MNTKIETLIADTPVKTAEDFDQADYEDEFLEWLYANYPIGNNHKLIAHLEDSARFESFLESKGLI